MHNIVDEIVSQSADAARSWDGEEQAYLFAAPSEGSCKGCESQGVKDHNVDCLFQHFLSYTGYRSESEDVIAKLKIAYEHGSERATRIAAMESGE